MSRIIITSFFLCYLINNLFSYTVEPSTKKFVWAPNGLNVRAEPSTKADIISKVTFGDSLTLMDLTDISFNIQGLKIDSTVQSYSRHKLHPYIMHGKWVQVFTSEGSLGYVIDHYLLDIKPHEKSEGVFRGNFFKLQSQDTTYKSTIIRDGEGLNYIISKKYEHQISEQKSEGGVWGQSIFTLPNISIQQAYVIFIETLENKSSLKVTLNWNEKLVITDGFCNYTFTKEVNGTKVEIGCSC